MNASAAAPAPPAPSPMPSPPAITPPMDRQPVPLADWFELSGALGAAVDRGHEAAARYLAAGGKGDARTLTKFVLGELQGTVPDATATKAELAQLHAIVATRTKPADREARWLADSHRTAWRPLATADGATGATLLKRSRELAHHATDAAKKLFARPRPYVTDPTLVPLRSRSTRPGTKPSVEVGDLRSYPSGHASEAFASALAVGRANPAVASQARYLAERVAQSRMYAAVHHRSDVVAGAFVGTIAADVAAATLPTTKG